MAPKKGLNPNFNSVNTPGAENQKVSPFTELGTTGLKIYAGQVREEFLIQLQGRRYYRILQEMRDNDPVIGAIMFSIEMLVRQVAWSAEPESDKPEDLQAADFLESCLDDMSVSWDDVLAEILGMLTYGWSYHEIVYKRRMGPANKDPSRRSRYSDGLIGWRKLPVRAQDTLYRWEMDDSGGVQGMWQQAPGYPAAYIPIEKALLFRTVILKGSPIGRSLLRSAYRPWYFKKRMEEIEAIGVERDLAGIPLIYAPGHIMSSTAPANDKALYSELKKIVQNVRNDEQSGLIIPGDRDNSGNRLFEFSLLSTAGNRVFDTNRIIQRYATQITMTVLADFIMLGHEKVGSFSLSSDKTEMFAVAIGAFLDEIAAVFNRHAVPRLFELNPTLKGRATLVHGDIENANIATMATAIKDFAAAGWDMTDIENEIRRRVGLPERATLGDSPEDVEQPRNAPELEDEPYGEGNGNEPKDVGEGE